MSKKTISLLIVVVVLLASSSVFAVNGTYEGFPTVNVKVNGQTIESDVPAINLNGRTMVPVRFVSEALGANVTWDGTTNTVNIYKDQRDVLQDFRNFSNTFMEILKEEGVNIKILSVNTNQQGTFIYAVYEPPDDVTYSKLEYDLIYLTTLSAGLHYRTDGTIIEVVKGNQTIGTIGSDYETTQKFYNFEISRQEFIESWKSDIIDDLFQTNNQSDVQNYDEIESQINEAYCAQINDIYDDQIRQFEEIYGSAGFGRSSRLEDAKKEIEEERERMLTIYGCN